MPSPIKLNYFQSNYKDINNVVEFKKQTIQLLKVQAQKLKEANAQLSSKQQELMIKQQQINFLKQTVQQVEMQNEDLMKQNNELRVKLQRVVEQIQVYNQKVVKKVCEERDDLRKYSKELKTENQQLAKQYEEESQNRLSQFIKLQSSQKELLSIKQLIKLEQIKAIQLQHKTSKQQINSQKQMQKILKLTNSLNIQESKRQKLQIQLSTLNKQLNNVVTKYNTMTKDYEENIKKIKLNTIDKSQLNVYQELVKSKQQQLYNLQNETRQHIINYQELKSNILDSKQKYLKQIATLKIKLNQISTDLLNLKKSFQIQRKIIQFQSDQRETFYYIYEKFESQHQQNIQLRQKYQQVLNQKESQRRDILKLQNCVQDNELEQTLLKTQLQEQLERLQSSYQGRLVSLNLKIRTQEEALQKLKKGQLQAMQQNQQIYEQLQKCRLDFSKYKETSEKSLERVNEQNYKIVEEMKQLYKICEQSVDNKRIVDKIKLVVHNLLIGIHYFQLKALRNREKQRKIYMPFVEFYLLISKRIRIIEQKARKNFRVESQKKQEVQTKREPQKESRGMEKQGVVKRKGDNFGYNLSKAKMSCLRRLRVGVWTVIAVLRMKKIREKDFQISCRQNGYKMDDISCKLMKGVKSRNKMHNMKEILQKEFGVYEERQDQEQIVLELIRVTKGQFSWVEANYRKIELQMTKYCEVLDRIQD